MQKKKTYVLILSKTFPSHHQKAGQKTHFRQSYLDGIKKHTIRANYPLWKKRIDEVNDGKAIISIREWSGKPYCSKQVEIGVLEKAGYEKIKMQGVFSNNKKAMHAEIKLFVDGRNIHCPNIPIFVIMVNDGFQVGNTIFDFCNWFFRSKRTKQTFDGIIIHFTELRYKEFKDEI